MRLPDPPEKAEKTHFLTDYYLKTEFGLDTLPFKNIDKNAFLKFYNMEPIRIEGIALPSIIYYLHGICWFLKL